MPINTLRYKVRNFYDIQRLRIMAGQRTPKEGADLQLEPDDIEYFKRLSDGLEVMEKDAQKELETEVKNHPLWKAFLEEVKGCGISMSAVILSEFDIHRATTVSKMWAVCGVGKEKKWCVEYEERTQPEPTEKKPEPKWTKWKKQPEKTVWGTSEPSALNAIPRPRKGKVERRTLAIARVDELEERQKRREGQYPTYNNFLKTKMVGVLASSFMRAATCQYKTFYYDYKNRCAKQGIGKGMKWVSKGHADNASKRFMIKQFLKDLYANWRAVEKLPVRPPYQEEYLGKVHGEEESIPVAVEA